MAYQLTMKTFVRIPQWPQVLWKSTLNDYFMRMNIEIKCTSLRCKSTLHRGQQSLTSGIAGLVTRSMHGQRASHGKIILSFASPFFFRKRKGEEPQFDHELEVLSHIPREVFKKDDPCKQKPRKNFLVEVISFLYNNLNYWVRVLRLTVTFVPILITYPLTFCSKSCTRFWWHWLLRACQWSGPTYIKLGQWAATRRDLFSDEFCDLFATLHARVRAHSWYTTRRKLTRAFGKNWTKIFVAVDKKPIGSGCIAQVHKAYMHPDMIPSETVIDEAHEDLDDVDSDIDFSDGLEILGFGHIVDSTEDLSEHLEYEWSKRWWHQSTPSNIVTTQGGLESQENVRDVGVPGGQPTEHNPSNQSASGTEEQQLIPVAIKVLHPGVYRSVCRDLTILHAAAQFAEFIFPSLRWLSLTECVEEFSDLLIRQIDLRYEARSLDVFVENFKESPNIRFPRPVRPYCKFNVLVETFEEGKPISNFVTDKDEQPAGLRELLAGYGLDALLQMIFVDNFLHGDLHPGNILVQNAKHFVPEEENKLVLVDVCDTVVVNVKPADTPVRLVLLDVGISSSLNQQDSDNFKNVFSAVVVGDGERVAQLMLEHSRYNDCKDIASFTSDMGKIVTEARRETIKLGKTNVSRLLGQVFTLFRQHKVKMESNFASVILAIFVLEGLGRSLDPDVDILERAKPVLHS